MEITTATLMNEAEEAVARGDHLAALRRFGEVLRLSPEDDRARLKVGLTLGAMGRTEAAVNVLRTAATIAGRRGFVLSAIAAAKDALDLLPDDKATLALLDSLHRRIAGLEPSVRPHVPPPVAPKPVPEDKFGSLLDELEDTESVSSRAGALGASTPDSPGTEVQPAAVPIFSALSSASFIELIRNIAHRRVPAGINIVEQGGPGTTLYVVVQGDVAVKRSLADKEITLARLGGGSIFGEMALITEQPRFATVSTLQPVELFEIDRSRVEAIAAAHPAIPEAIVQFARRRMLTNLLATSPIFRPFAADERLQLLKSFSSRVVPAGTEIIAEGFEPTALYVLANGEIEITKKDEQGDRLVLARLHEGDVFGEIALLGDTLTTATATAATKVVLLVLERAKFAELTAKHPEIKAYLATLSEDRLKETRAVLEAGAETLEADDLILV